MRVEQLQEKFDGAFMKLDMMECDRAIKTQAKVDLNSIYFFMQGAIAAANNCADVEATKLYNQADMMLNNFIKNSITGAVIRATFSVCLVARILGVISHIISTKNVETKVDITTPR